MHITRNIICFVMLTVFAVQYTESQEPVSSKEDTKLVKMGIGFQSGIRFHQPDQLNEFVTNLYDAFVSEYVDGPTGKKKLGPGVFITLNGTFDIGPVFSAVPFGQGMWAGKQFFVSGGPAGNIHINTYTAMGGLNLWARVLNLNVFKLRLGTGIYGTYTIANITGDIRHQRIYGKGIGGRALLGSEYKLNETVTLTFDCGLSFGKTNLYDDKIRVSGIPVSYPSKLDHLGFELFPGVMFYF